MSAFPHANAAEMVIRGLAAQEPWTVCQADGEEDELRCAFCEVAEFKGYQPVRAVGETLAPMHLREIEADVSDHEPDCIWRLAREWVVSEDEMEGVSR